MKPGQAVQPARREAGGNSEAAIREALAAQGIDSLDSLVARLSRRPAPLEAEEDPLIAIASQAAATPGPKPHKVPDTGLVVDGAAMAANSIADFTGRELYSTPGLDSNGRPTLYSFTNPSLLWQSLTAIRPLHDLGTNNPDSLPDVSTYFEHEDGQGDRLQNNPGRAWRDLTRVRRGFLGLSDWNDIVSSVGWCRWDVILYEHTNYQGSRLYLRAGRTYYHLTQFGWNDRTSSMVNLGRRN
jgi:hypothetical protein